MSDYKACVACGKSFPRTEQYFHKSKDGFHSRCKKCRNKEAVRGRKRKANAKLEQIEKGAVRLFTEAATIGGAHIPHSSEMIEVIMEYFGGVRGFGNAFMKQFYDSPPGGAFRTKMLDTVVRLVKDNTAMGGAKKPLDLMTEDELESDLRRQILLAVRQHVEGKTIDGKVLQNLPVVGAGESGEADGVLQAVSAADAGGRVSGPAVDAGDRVLRGVEGDGA